MQKKKDINELILSNPISRVTHRTVYIPEFTPGFCGVCGVRSLVFCVMFCRSLFVIFVLFLKMLTESSEAVNQRY
jgi:hypothetical protein